MSSGPGFVAVGGMIVGGLVCLGLTVGIVGLAIWLITRNKEEL